MFEKIIEKFSKLDEVEAIALGGSRATGVFDEYSDYDVYIYLSKALSEEKRKNILEEYCQYMEYSNNFWELEDDGIMNNGVEIELIYRSLDFLPDVLSNLFDRKNASIGYTTCFYDNLIDSKILYDRNSFLEGLKQKYNNAYTQEISTLIIQKNLPLLKDSMPALYNQIIKAIKRDDKIAVNHRISEFFAIYYDILFALNLEPHPGEKRLHEQALKSSVLPANYNKNITNIFSNITADYNVLTENLEELIKEIKQIT